MKSERLKYWIKKQLRDYKIWSFYYLTMIDNLETIAEYGILPRNKCNEKIPEHGTFANEMVQSRRHKKGVYLTENLKVDSLHDLVPLYLTPKTPTMYAIKEKLDKIVILQIKSYILLDNEIHYAFTDGNAASLDTGFYYSLNNLRKLPWEVIRAPSWTNHEDGTRKRNSEFLIYPSINFRRIWSVGVKSNETLLIAKEIIEKSKKDNIEIKIKEEWFF